ncbi:hypothetical protein Moror_1109 [Moniliophthora roreri MCA 2997]|uniref:F-box domain-containing protein n=2 Tax=Moniliophthora roreri TaxID=221103 RepID=V2X252_MONRO|nr:hypothetical protein Moror_1109 [Moniliophthora roreri MCA 2997]KAI3598515.1 hypothetical protein WG66_017113 [Moniliophthora roreri]
MLVAKPSPVLPAEIALPPHSHVIEASVFPHNFRTSGGPHLLNLPLEILDVILSEIDLRSDLIALALASRTCAHLVIPRHNEYRIIRTRHRFAGVWAHLARRSDLARNVRRVNLCMKENRLASDCWPSTLVPPSSSNPKDLEVARMTNICRALRHMNLLEEFTLENPDDRDSVAYLSTCREGDILHALGTSTRLSRLALSGYVDLRTSDPLVRIDQVWNMKYLQHVSLRGETWALPSMGLVVREILKRSPLIKFLEIPLEVTSLENSFFPHLRGLRLFLQSGAGSASSRAWSTFLINHPDLEELSCSPLLVTLPVKGLRALKCLQTDLNALGEFGVEDDECAVQCVDAVFPLSTLGDRFLKSKNCANLRKLSLRTWPHMLLSYAKSFPNLEWLSVGVCPFMDLDDILAYLSALRNLRVFRGDAIWKAVGLSDEKMHVAIMKLVQFCPNLKELDHRKFHEKRRAFKRIVIRREEIDGVLCITYDVRSPSPRSTFDTAGGAFD